MGIVSSLIAGPGPQRAAWLSDDRVCAFGPAEHDGEEQLGIFTSARTLRHPARGAVGEL
jgi:hypothetical protein